MRLFVRRRSFGIQARLTMLAVATALNGAIGYDKATAIVKTATESGRPLREVALEEGIDAKLYDATIDLKKIAAGNLSK